MTAPPVAPMGAFSDTAEEGNALAEGDTPAEVDLTAGSSVSAFDR